jgi:putative transposase
MQRLWGRKVSDLAFYSFRQILDYVAKRKGKVVAYVDRFFPSSKLCHCGHKNDKLTLSDRRWRCPKCQRVNDRDKNAAKNILLEGASSSNSHEPKERSGYDTSSLAIKDDTSGSRLSAEVV